MFTNRKLYTLKPDAYETGDIVADKLIVNRIDADFLSHLIFMPEFVFDSYELFDVNKLRNDTEARRNALISDLKQKPCKAIIGFKQNLFGRFKFNESDIAIETNMFVVLQLIHACQLVNLEEFADHNKDNLIDKIENRKRSQGNADNRSRGRAGQVLKPSRHPRNMDSN